MSEWDEIFEEESSPISEAYDSSWRWNFSWAYDHQTGRVDVWKTQGSGNWVWPGHREEVNQRWGRLPKTTEGDILGTATYIPPERKLDGTVVAPADIQIHPYYNALVPAQIKQWFEDQFPQGIVRQASVNDLLKVATDVGEGWHAEDGWNDESAFEPVDLSDYLDDSPVYKWLWNKHDGLLIWETSNQDGLPTHTQKCNMEWDRDVSTSNGDVLGYAYIDYPDDGIITLESFDSNDIPHSAFEDVKQQLKEWFPEATIKTDQGPPEKHEFDSDPADYREAAVEWANTYLGGFVSPPEATPAKTGLLARIFPKRQRQKLAEADMDGAMVALFVPKETAEKLKVRGGESTDQMHITLLYFIDKAADRDDWDEVKKIIEQVANQTPPLSGKVSGYGVFNAPDGDVLWASPSVQGLAELRHKVFEACEDAGFHVSTDHDWAPHITLKYQHKGKLPDNEEIELDFSELSFAQGEDHHNYALSGAFEKRAADFAPPRVMYHAGWEEDVPSIEETGLQPAASGAWNEVKSEENPPGVYLFENLSDAQEYGSDREEPTAIWEVDTAGLSLQPDAIFEHEVESPHAWYSTSPISPERLRRIATSDYLDWSGWEGAHRFVTDGKEILTDPESGGIDPSNWKGTDELRQKFMSFYPDVKSVVAGWTVPTADKMGLGIWAPAAGHGDKHEPGLHEIIAIVEKEFSKPAHMITNENHLQDSKMYDPGVTSDWQQI